MKELEQTVKLFIDSDKTGIQSVSIDPKDNWIIVEHDSNAISLSIDNWIKLVALAERGIKDKRKRKFCYFFRVYLYKIRRFLKNEISIFFG